MVITAGISYQIQDLVNKHTIIVLKHVIVLIHVVLIHQPSAYILMVSLLLLHHITSDPIVTGLLLKQQPYHGHTDRTCDSRIQYGTSSGIYFDEEVSNSTHVTSHSLNLTNLSAGTTYYYKARFTDEDGNLGESDEYSFTTDPAPVVNECIANNISIA